MVTAVIAGELGMNSEQQIITEVCARAATFPSQKNLSSRVGICPGDEESAGVSHSHRSSKGNRRILNQTAHAAVKVKGSIFEIVYRAWFRGFDLHKPSAPLPTGFAG